MKKRIIITVLLIIALLVTGCGKVSFELTRIGDNTTIKATAADGKTADTEYFTVGKDEQVTVDASLEKGALSLEFISVDVFIQSDNSPDDVIEHLTIEAQMSSGVFTKVFQHNYFFSKSLLNFSNEIVFS